VNETAAGQTGHIVNTADRHLYLIMGNGVAMRYGVGVGRDGFQWGGIQKITVKREWPDRVPPPEMIERQPYLSKGARSHRTQFAARPGRRDHRIA
jgi:lipoprotein-anchoring transpeptidase ErfK/SrfK